MANIGEIGVGTTGHSFNSLRASMTNHDEFHRASRLRPGIGPSIDA